MNFLFIHSWQGFSLAEWYLKSALREHYANDLDFKSLDLPGIEIPANDTTVRVFFHFKPSLVGFSCFYWNIGYFLHISEWIKKVSPETKIVFGGPQVRSVKASEEILKNNKAVDYVVRGEGEQALISLVGKLTSPMCGSMEDVPNLSFRSGELIRHNREPGIVYTRNLIFSRANEDLSTQVSSLDEVSYETIMGCYKKCAFCYYPSAKHIMVDDELVFSELSYLCSQPIRNLRICDTHFGGNAQRAKRILRHLSKHNKGITVRIYPDIDHVDQEYINLVRDSGASVTSISIQTTNKVALKAIRRKAVHQQTSQIRMLLEAFPEVPADLIIGLPGDSVHGLKQTFEDVLELGFKRVNLFRLMLFPGTEMYENRSRFFELENLVVSSSGQVIASSDFPPEVQPEVSQLLMDMETRCSVGEQDSINF